MAGKLGSKIRALYRRELDVPAGGRARFRFRGGFRATLRIVLVMVLIAELATIHFFRVFVALRQEICIQASRLEVEYQRRDNLIPRLAVIAGDYARHERALMTYVSDARALQKYTGKLKGLSGPESGARLERGASRLVALAEQYPDLKADRSYQALMAKLTATENRISAARKSYAALVNEYNREVITFPHITFARLLQFHKIESYSPQKDTESGRNNRFFFIF
ncbi:MAG: LemA family protein [Elusimicrobiota bacterium]|nr:LemA family protein [Elusimicrobiota bacterium]